MKPERARLAAIPEATTRELLAWLVQRRGRFTVVGASMEPTLVAGDVLFIDRSAYRTHTPTPGHVVVLDHPSQPGLRIVKRVEKIDPDGRCRLLSDNLSVEGADSRSFGSVPPSDLLGRVTARLKR